MHDTSARAGFAELVGRHGSGRTANTDFVPKKLVFANLHDMAKPITPTRCLPSRYLPTPQPPTDTLNEIGVEVEAVSVSQSARYDQQRKVPGVVLFLREQRIRIR